MRRFRGCRARLLSLLVAVLGSGLLVGCGGDPQVSPSLTERSGAVIEPTAELLPTPTLAVPAASGTADPLRPPTPMVLPSATPSGAVSDVPTSTSTDVPAEMAGGEAVSETATAQPTPTIDLPSGATSVELADLGRRRLAEGDYRTAAAAFAAAYEVGDGLTERQVAEARLGHGVALLEDGRPNEAAMVFESLLQEPSAATTPPTGQVASLSISDAAAFHLGQARAALGDQAAAVEAFSAYMQNNPDMAAYVQPLIADAHAALGDTNEVLTALERSLEGTAQRFRVVENRGRLAALHLERGDYAAAIAQYDAIRDIARTDATKGQMTYLAGQAELLAGNTDAAHERFLSAVETYPRAHESYLALVALIEAGVSVDEYQRGVVDYYAGAYAPAVEALLRYLDAAGENYATDAHLFLAWSYEQLGDVEAGLAALGSFAEHDPARALFERAEMLSRAGRDDEALDAYDEFLADHPDAEGAASVAASAAAIADRNGRDDAAERYIALADAFPFNENTPGALFRAAELIDAAGEPAAAIALWQRLSEQYPANIHGAEALFRLLRLAESDSADELDVESLAAQVETLPRSNYFALRAADHVAGIAPFSAGGSMTLPTGEAAGRAEAEAWLRRRLADQTTSVSDISALSPELAADPQRLIGEKLWQLGLLEAAKAELETVREAYAGDPLANYQMALYFSELGLYRSSIVAATALLQQTDATVFDAPLFLGRLAYPAYYADLILPLADRYGYDPRLQFALVRQESLFESFARSGAAAQGLSQVIPDTGAWIAQRLAWPEYENSDLYKPYVGLNFGAFYLSEQLRTFDNHVPAALAAYNAGPGNAARWFDVAGTDLDLFVDTIDFAETRLYIERIYEGFNAYRHLYPAAP